MAAALEVSSGVFQLPLLGAWITALVDGDDVVLVDAGLRSSPVRAKAFLERQGLCPAAVSHILITHGHVDHIAGLARLRELTGAQVAAHPLEAPAICGSCEFPNPVTVPILRDVFSPVHWLLRPRPAAVDLLLEDGAEVEVAGGIRAVHTPGHTPGSLSFYLPDRGLLFVGDALQHLLGRLRPPDPVFSQDMALARRSIQRLATLDVDTICFAHFPPIKSGGGRRLRGLAGRLAA